MLASAGVPPAAADDGAAPGRVPAHARPEDLQVPAPAEGAAQVHGALSRRPRRPAACPGRHAPRGTAGQRTQAQDGEPRAARTLAGLGRRLAGWPI